jgi:hypothetical protein
MEPRKPKKPQISLDDRKVETLLDSIAQLKGFHNPESWNYQARNPLGVKSFAPLGRHEIDDEGRRIFPSQLAGIKACLYDLEMKIRGESRAGLKITDRISNLLRVYGISEILGQQQVLKWFRRATKDSTVTLDTELTFFHQTKESR